MYLFHTLVFDDSIEGTATVYTDPRFNEHIATADKLQIQGIAAQASGTTPAITVQLEHSADDRNFVNKSGTAEINAVSLSTSLITNLSGNDQGAVPTGGFARLRLSLGGTNPKTRLRLWVTGRST